MLWFQSENIRSDSLTGSSFVSMLHVEMCHCISIGTEKKVNKNKNVDEREGATRAR